jgi:hypothetical protein
MCRAYPTTAAQIDGAVEAAATPGEAEQSDGHAPSVLALVRSEHVIWLLGRFRKPWRCGASRRRELDR